MLLCQIQSATWMTLFVNCLQTTMLNVCVDLSCANAGVAQHLLECSNVRAAGKKMGGKTVAQSVRTHFSSAADTTGITLHQ